MTDQKTVEILRALCGYLDALFTETPVTLTYLERLHEHYMPALETAIKELEKHHG